MSIGNTFWVLTQGLGHLSLPLVRLPFKWRGRLTVSVIYFSGYSISKYCKSDTCELLFDEFV